MSGILEQHLAEACRQLDIEVMFGHCIQLGDCEKIRSTAYFPSIWAERGMLVFKSFDAFQAKWDDLRAAGYGYAVLEEPKPDEQFDLNLYREIFEDWGWHANPPT